MGEKRIEPPADGETYEFSDGPTYRLQGQPGENNDTAVETSHPIPRAASKVRRFFTEHWEHESETSLFLLVSMLDFFCTYLLLMTSARGGGVRFMESNPLAAWFLNHYGPLKGLLGFKLTLVVLICGLAQTVSYSKPAYGRGILLFGTVLTTGVVIYSVTLLLRSYI